MSQLDGSIDTSAPVSTNNGKSGSSLCDAACTKSACPFNRSQGAAAGLLALLAPPSASPFDSAGKPVGSTDTSAETSACCSHSDLLVPSSRRDVGSESVAALRRGSLPQRYVSSPTNCIGKPVDSTDKPVRVVSPARAVALNIGFAAGALLVRVTSKQTAVGTEQRSSCAMSNIFFKGSVVDVSSVTGASIMNFSGLAINPPSSQPAE